MHFQQVQQAFVAHIKNPELPMPEGIAEDRMAVYRELFFNNVQGFVGSAFPVLKSLYPQARWQALVRQFFIRFTCNSPYFLHIAEHFLHFLQQDYQPQAEDPPFLLDLAHYEWAELYLSTKQLQQQEQPLSAEHLSEAPLALSALTMLLAYPYPVHLISSEFQPQADGETQCYLLYRNRGDEVKFVLINPLTAALLHHLQQAPGSTLQQLVELIAPFVPQLDSDTLLNGASTILQDFAAKGLLMSFQAGQNSLP
ncbi:HvfC family RiPP maturation protein [Rheinheimera fenheensis]|uniref:HvfC family RiPP maturation protein n=1 Tax=Rheinheimera fenheensis TaxID=3152295 RepID=UPI00325F4F4A